MYIFIRLKRVVIIAFLIISLSMTAFSLSFIKNQSVANAEESISVPIIMYHHILKDKTKSGKYIITPEEFESDLKFLKDSGYTTVTVKDLINYVNGEGKLPKKPVILSFDDGHESNYAYAYPVIKKGGNKIVISIVGKYSEDSSKDEESHISYSYLKWSEIKEMHASGLVEFANHSYNCHDRNKRKGINKLKSESDEEYKIFLTNDLNTLNLKLKEATGENPVTFTYPFGNVQKKSLDIIKNAGFSASLSCEEGINYISKGNPECLYLLKRYNRPSGISSEKFFKKILAESD